MGSSRGMAIDRSRAVLPRAFTRPADDAVRDAWRALWTTRLVVWIAGVAAVAFFGTDAHNETSYDAAAITRPFGSLGDALVAPAARWDSVWYLQIAAGGYDDQRAAFFPLYPLLAKAGGALFGSALVAGVVISVG